MKKKERPSEGFDKLRSMAEERLGRRQADPDRLTEAEAKKLLHELQVHQIELEMQNEELRKAQAEIEESRARYADLYDFSPVGYITIDSGLRVIEANLTACELLSCPRELLLKRNFATFTATDDRQALGSFLERVCTGAASENRELRLKKKDGTVFYARLDAVTAPDGAGSVSGSPPCRVSIVDISDKKAAENELEKYRDTLEALVRERTKALEEEIADGRAVGEALKRSETNLVKAQEVAHIGSWQLDLINNNLVWTDENYKIFGVPRESSMTYERFLEIVHPEDREFVAGKWRAAIAGEPYDIEHRLLIGNEVKWVREKAELDFDDTKTPTSGTGITQDITERKQLEAQALKVQKLESLGLLAGGIAHDFNNFLTGILGNLSLLELNFANDQSATERVLAAEKAAIQAQCLTQQLLTFSRGGKPVKETVPLGPVLCEAAGFALRGTNVKFDYFVADDLWPVDADKGQIYQVVNNLAINAVQAMPEGGTFKLTAVNHTADEQGPQPLTGDRYVKVSMEDRGTGIPEKFLAKIFDPYFTTKQKGSGLGLSSAYSIIKKHGGHIDVISQPGIGTTFYIYLPASAKKISVKAEALEEARVSAGGRVLVMDDDELIRDVAIAILTAIGYEVVTVEEGEEAIALYEEAMGQGRCFDVVIMDLTIPGGIGGKEAIKRLLELDPSARVIVSSGYSNDPIMSDCARYGFSGMVTKPYRASELGAKVQQVLAGKV